jgi:tRNA-dihydrouridine synthase B
MENQTNKPVAFWVKNIPVYGDLVLAPMDGVSDLPFRSLAWELGSAMNYTEFVNAIDVVRDLQSVEQRLAYREDQRPVVFQIFDDDPDRLVEAGLRLMQYHPDILDINMGCPSKDVAGRGAGAGLLRRPEKIAEIFRKLTRALPIPVTGKIRLGWDEASKNYLEVAKIIEDNGGSLIAVHARTKIQGYAGDADWDSIARIKETVNIPVLGNGDVCSVLDIENIKSLSRCDGVMIGRSAIDNPWIFSRMDRSNVSLISLRQVVLMHLDQMLDFYGERGLIMFRKFLKGYLRPFSINPNELRNLLTCIDIPAFKSLLESTFSKLAE